MRDSLWTAPIPNEGRLNKRIRTALMERVQKRQLARIASEVGEDMPDRQPKSKLPADAISLRGVPFVGRGIGGVIIGTAPESESVKRVGLFQRRQQKISDLSKGVE